MGLAKCIILFAFAFVSCSALINLQSTQNTILIVSVGFQRATATVVYNDCTPKCIEATMWGDVARVFTGSSRGVFGFAPPPSSKVVQVAATNLTWPDFNCDLADSWYKAAQAALAMPDAEYTKYDAHVYVYPQAAGMGICTIGGLSNQGCTANGGCTSWLRAFGAGLVIHELGHLMNLSHAAYDKDGNGVVSGNEDTADSSDPMTSDGTVRGYNAPNRIRNGWLACSARGFTVTTNPRVLLSASAYLEPTVLCVTVPQQPRMQFVVSGRSNHGVDVALGPQWVPAVYLHRQNMVTGKSVLLGFAKVGDTFVYSGPGLVNVTVTLVAANGPNLTVSFEKCVRNRPQLTASAAFATSAASAASAASVTVTITNTDRHCPARANVTVRDTGPTPACNNLTIIVHKDSSPKEIFYDVLDSATGAALLPQTFYTATAPEQVHVLKVCAEATVRFFDSQGDGYCCAFGPGWFRVLVNSVEVWKGGEFRFNTTTTIPAGLVWIFPSLKAGATATLTQLVPFRTPSSPLSNIILKIDGMYVFACLHVCMFACLHVFACFCMFVRPFQKRHRPCACASCSSPRRQR